MRGAVCYVYIRAKNRTVKCILCRFDELFKAYYNSLLVLKENGYHSISFPLISSSIFGGNLENPVAESTKQCVRAYKKFTEEYHDYEIDVKLCAFTSTEMQKAKVAFDAEMGR